MSLAFAPQDPPLRFRVFHRYFSRDRAYPLVAASDFADTAPARLWFVNDRGWLWAVDQRRCIAVDAPLSRLLSTAEAEGRALPRRRPRSDFQ